MTTQAEEQRASMGFGDELEALDTSDWTPAKPTNDPKPTTAQIEKIAEQQGFTSRQPKKAEPPPEPTGQVNIKALQSAIEGFRDISKSQTPKWPQGYTFERAVAALKRELDQAG